MRFRFLIVFICMILAAGSVSADTKIPTRAVFCRGLERLSEAIEDGRAVRFTLGAQPRAAEGVSQAALAALSGLSLEGVVWASKEGGQTSLALCAGNETVLRVNSVEANGLTAVDLGAGLLAAKTENGAETAARLGLGALGALLFTVDYSTLREGVIPYFTPVYEAGETLWRLASPYAEDNNLLSTGSGATSHALTYRIDTKAFREIAAGFADALEAADLLLPGVPRESVDAFIGKVRRMAESAELTKDIKANLTFGEGDIMRTARMSGTVRMDGRSAGVSYSYNCRVTGTRLTRSYSLKYEPSVGDTVSLSVTWLTSSSGKGGAAHELSVSAGGKYDGEPYSIRVKSEMVNKYETDGETRLLREVLTGEASAAVKYAGETVVSGAVSREGTLLSTSDEKTIDWNDAFTGSIALYGREAFDGTVYLHASALEKGAEPYIVLNDAQRADEMDDAALSGVRAWLDELFEAAVSSAAALLPDSLRHQISISE